MKTSTIRLEIAPGAYDNDDAYEKVIGYIMKKHVIGGYGYNPFEIGNIIPQFELSKLTSHQTSQRNIWHFYITFSDIRNVEELYTIADMFAQLFAPHYQIIFGVDIKGKPHLHFAVNAYSYHPDIPTLTHFLIEPIMHNILHLLHIYYPSHKTIFQPNKGGSRNV